MIVTCPDCASQYRVDPDAFRSGGRSVRCGRCACEWYQAAPEFDVAADIGAAPELDAEAADVAAAACSIAAADPEAKPMDRAAKRRLEKKLKADVERADPIEVPALEAALSDVPTPTPTPTREARTSETLGAEPRADFDAPDEVAVAFALAARAPSDADARPTARHRVDHEPDLLEETDFGAFDGRLDAPGARRLDDLRARPVDPRGAAEADLGDLALAERGAALGADASAAFSAEPAPAAGAFADLQRRRRARRTRDVEPELDDDFETTFAARRPAPARNDDFFPDDGTPGVAEPDGVDGAALRRRLFDEPTPRPRAVRRPNRAGATVAARLAAAGARASDIAGAIAAKFRVGARRARQRADAASFRVKLAVGAAALGVAALVAAGVGSTARTDGSFIASVTNSVGGFFAAAGGVRAGVVFVDSKYDLVKRPDGLALEIWGVIANNGPDTALTPTIEIVTRSKNGEPLQRFYARPERDRLDPSKATRFTARMMNPKGPIHDVDLYVVRR